MNSNLWIKRILGIASAISLMVAIMVIPSPAEGAVQASSLPANQARLADTPAPMQSVLAGDDNWSGQFQLGADDWVFAEAFAPNGDLYVGGAFYHIAGISANHVARWSASSNQWSALGSGVSDTVTALLVSGNTLYVGGYFTIAGGAPAGGIASYDLSSGSWSNMGGGMTRPSGPVVFALATDGGGNLYASGTFDMAGSISTENIARWDGSSWSDVGGGLGLSDDQVKALAVSGSNVYAAGSITSPSGNIFLFNGASWTSVGGGADGVVFALALSGNNLYVGGSFTTVNSGALTVNYVALWDTNTSSWSALGSGLNGTRAEAIAVDGSGNVYVTGSFNLAGGLVANNVAMWNGSSWSRLMHPNAVAGGVIGEGFSLAVSSNDVYVGGNITIAGAYKANNLARWVPAYQYWTAPGNSVNGPIEAIAISGKNIYVGGDFTSAGGLLARSIAGWNSSTHTWFTVSSYLLDGCTGATFCVPTVKAIAVNGSDVYVGGNFISAGAQTVNNIARVNNTTWYAMDGGVTNCGYGGCVLNVWALAVDGSGVDVGGRFILAGATTVNSVARWDGSAWHAFTDIGNSNTGTNGVVFAIATDAGGEYYFGGSFSVPYTNLTFFDGYNFFTGWSALNGDVTSIALDGSDVYVAGDFTNAAGNNADYVAVSRAGSDWQPLGASLNSAARSMAMQGSRLIVGGVFTKSGALVVNHVAVWDTVAQSWSSLGSGTDDQVAMVAADPYFIYVGGTFANAGGKPSLDFGRYGQIALFLPLAMK